MEGIDAIFNKLFLEADSGSVEHIDEIRKSLNNVGIKLIGNIDISNFSSKFDEIYNTLFNKLSIPEVNEDGEFVFSPEIICIKEYYSEHLKLLTDLNQFIILYRKSFVDGYNDKFIRNIVMKCLIIYTQFSSEQIYANLETVALAENGIQILLSICKCQTTEELLFGSQNMNENEERPVGESSAGIVCDIMQKLLWELLTLYKDIPKIRMAYAPSFFWLLHNSRGEHMETYGGHIVNFFLVLLDDLETNHKTHAITAFNEIIDRMIAGEFELYDRNLVVYNAILLQVHRLSSHELLRPVYVCLIKWARYIDNAKSDDDNSDDVIQKLLLKMITEERLLIRQIYAESLLSAIETFGITAISHWISINKVIKQYLQDDDGPDAKTRIITLDVIIASMKEFWPVFDDTEMVELIQPALRFFLIINSGNTINIEAQKIAEKKCKIIVEHLNCKQKTAMRLRLDELIGNHLYLQPILDIL